MCSAGAAPLRVRHGQRGESEASALLLTTSASARTECDLFELTRKETSHPPPNKSLQLSAPGFGPGLKPLVHTNLDGRHAACHPLTPLTRRERGRPRPPWPRAGAPRAPAR